MKNTAIGFYFESCTLDHLSLRLGPAAYWSIQGEPRRHAPAGPVVNVDYRTHLHALQSNAPKLIKLLLSFILAKLLLFGHTKAFR